MISRPALIKALVPLVLVLVAATFTASQPQPVAAQTLPICTVGGPIIQNTIWTADCVYVVEGDITVALGTTLSIEPSTIIKFHRQGRLVVNGKLDAQGTESQRIIFTSINDDGHGGDTDGDGTNTPPSPNDWGWIQFENSSDDSSVLRNCVVQYSGYKSVSGRDNYGAVTLVDAEPTIGNCTFQFNYLNGLNIPAGIKSASAASNVETWDNVGVPYIVNGDLIIAEGMQLIIQPNVAVKFHRQSRLIVRGKLDAQGTSEQRIVFTSLNDDGYGGDTDNDGPNTPPNASDWGWIQFEGTSDDSSVLRNCVVQYSGYKSVSGRDNYGAVTLIDAEPTIDNCTFQFNYLNGLDIPAAIKSASAASNTETWDNVGVPYIINGDLIIAEGMQLIIRPNVAVKFHRQSRLIVRGKLDAQGVSEQRVVFTSLNDDSYGGDTDNDGANTPPNASDWGWIQFEGTSDDSSVLRNCVVQYSGYKSVSGRDNYGAITMDNSSPSIINCTLTDNFRGIETLRNSLPTLTCNNIYSNSDFGIYNDTPSTLINAENQWWGDPSGPTFASNPGGTGQTVSDGVDFTPWSTRSCLDTSPAPTPTNTSVPTDTPIPPTPIPTNTPQPPTPVPPTATAVPPTPQPTPAIRPTLTDVRPNQGRANVPNDVNVYGGNFARGATVRLGETALSTTRVDGTLLQAVVPAGLSVGIYDVTVTNPDGGTATLANAYTVFETSSDDLFGNDYELWVDPPSPHAGEAARVGLIVQRQGGKETLSDVTVRFYLGDPDAGGTRLGDGAISLLSPRSSDSTSGVAWTPSKGEQTLFAVIDPDNRVAEAIESNNVVSRRVVVLPPAPDDVAPRVESAAVNSGSPATVDRNVALDATAVDPAPGTGVSALRFVEFEYSQAANQWVPVQESDWLGYDAARSSHPWRLIPATGMKYLQTWAVDGAGNISLFPFGSLINFLPPEHAVSGDQSRIYRYALRQGQTLTARVEPLEGDPDLYVWAPDHETRPPWVSNGAGGNDAVSFVAPVDGTYQVEVYGYTAAKYRLIVDVTENSVISADAAYVNQEKAQPAQPVVPVGSLPGAQYALVSPGATGAAVDYRLHLPLVRR